MWQLLQYYYYYYYIEVIKISASPAFKRLAVFEEPPDPEVTVFLWRLRFTVRAFRGNIREDSMSRLGPVSIGTLGSKVSWLVEQCFDLPRGRRVPREALSF